MYTHMKETTTTTTTAIPSGMKTVVVREVHETRCDTDGELAALQHLADTVDRVTDKLKDLEEPRQKGDPNQKPAPEPINEAASMQQPVMGAPAEQTPAWRIKQALAALDRCASHVTLKAADVRAMVEYIEGHGRV